MPSPEQEGVIKFNLQYTPGPALPAAAVADLIAWRQVLVRMQWMGQDPARYDGYGFGNISRRLAPFQAPPLERSFAITGSQTGHLAPFTAAHVARVTGIDPAQNRVTATGPVQPSSESMTHGMVYALAPDALYVMHVHAPLLWQHAAALHLPTTAADVPYGTPAMAQEVERLFTETPVRGIHLFAMAGHEDGIVAFGETALIAATALFGALARAYSL